jgi:two-component system CheB/CheR fusion protein
MDDTTTSPASPGPPAPGGLAARAGRDADRRIEPSPDHAEEDLADATDDAIPSRSFAMLPMVGLGGSAGSIGALQAFFQAAPSDTGMAFVVVLHLSADHESTLAEILQRTTCDAGAAGRRPGEGRGQPRLRDPAGKTLHSVGDHLVCADLTPSQARRTAVDLFFRTLADTHGPKAAAIVLSGADGDGAIGIKRIKERGGLTIAQDPNEAEHAGMPRSAIDTGMVDWILPVAQMPARLIAYTTVLGRLKLPPEQGPPPAAVDAPAHSLEETLRDLLTYLRTQTGCDFSYYKRATILRRIGRRMSVNGIEEMPAYLDFVRTHTGEAGALLKDLLISVTNFFRDRDAFDALKEHLPTLFAGKSAGDEVRVWVAACATGEEAYSIAMLLASSRAHARRTAALQVFATDLDDDAIRVAREGVYPPAIAADVSEERLRRFFTRDARGYRIRSELRESVVFASHDLLKDAPFSRLDLAQLPQPLHLPRIRGAAARARDRPLRAAPPAASLPRRLGDGRRREHLFAPVDKKHRIYEPRAVRERRVPVLADRDAARSIVPHLAVRRRARGGSGSAARPCSTWRGRAPRRSASAPGASCT